MAIPSRPLPLTFEEPPFPNLRRFSRTWKQPRIEGSLSTQMIRESRVNNMLKFVALHPSLEEVMLWFDDLDRSHIWSLTSILRHEHDLQRRLGHRHACLRKIHIDFNYYGYDTSESMHDFFREIALYSRGPASGIRSDGVRGSSSSATLSTITTPVAASMHSSLESFHFRRVDKRDLNGSGGGYTYEEDDDSDDVDDSDNDDSNEDNTNLYPADPFTSDLISSNCGLKELQISLPGLVSERQLLLPLLRRCPDLETLCLNWVHSVSAIVDLPLLLREHCTRLKRFSICEFSPRDKHLAHLIESCVAGLSSLEILDRLVPMGATSVEATARVHGGSLETLDLRGNRRWSSHYFLDLVTRCPRLQTLKASLELRSMDSRGESIDYETRLAISWPFRESLRVLDLTLYRGSDMEVESKYRPGDGSLTDQYIDYMYTQVGALHRLEELSLGGWMLLLRVEWGLPKLAGLKRLRLLDLRNHTFIKWSAVDVEWISDNWTGLKEIKGIKRYVDPQLLEYLETLEQADNKTRDFTVGFTAFK
ncbi:hypothetical protein BGZ99_006259 [Dissophora globulifera]|uniref:Uncharacterized protein n=1 Tax=Dissophora globulifera TaxID=979702 RepID=A0A9P6UZU8_9FUNG|nr:hypothetical protein BGZ99_006259 [Dissophora globulifera]